MNLYYSIINQPQHLFFFYSGLLVSDYKLIFYPLLGKFPTFIPGGSFFTSIIPFYILSSNNSPFLLNASSTWYAVFAETYMKIKSFSLANFIPSSKVTLRLNKIICTQLPCRIYFPPKQNTSMHFHSVLLLKAIGQHY